MSRMLDVAKRAKVSLSTVSYALNGKRPISEKTRQRIVKAMTELGYRPHPLARGLASKHTRILAILFPTVERGLGITELDFVASAAHAASTNGYHLVVWSAETNDPHELQQLTQQGLVDGVILMEVHVNDMRVNLLRELKFPFTMIGRCDDDRDGYVDIDFKQTVDEALSYLAGLGHTDIAFLNQSRMSYEAGYGPVVRTKAAFEERIYLSGLKGVMRFCRPLPQAGYEAFNALIKKHPVLRLHGYRFPLTGPMPRSGAQNEVWSFGEATYAILKDLLALRERLRPYLHELMQVATERGMPPLRPLFLEFPEDPICETIEDQFMIGPEMLIAPVLCKGSRQRKIYLPAGLNWMDAWSGDVYSGGRSIEIPAPLERIPVFLKAGSRFRNVFKPVS
ncbi:MAG: LacI family DNA-binding transcriptional regulator [Chloroflexi bacterium]|nr:MAG: LacI family DNA-binding transcriptional regulator [Chloroflexota bacterium]